MGTTSEQAQLAVARRKTVSASVSDALADTHSENVVAELAANDGAVIREGTFQKVLDEFGDNERIHAPMVNRKRLPIPVAERLSRSRRRHPAAPPAPRVARAPGA